MDAARDQFDPGITTDTDTSAIIWRTCPRGRISKDLACRQSHISGRDVEASSFAIGVVRVDTAFNKSDGAVEVDGLHPPSACILVVIVMDGASVKGDCGHAFDKDTSR